MPLGMPESKPQGFRRVGERMTLARDGIRERAAYLAFQTTHPEVEKITYNTWQQIVDSLPTIDMTDLDTNPPVRPHVFMADLYSAIERLTGGDDLDSQQPN